MPRKSSGRRAAKRKVHDRAHEKPQGGSYRGGPARIRPNGRRASQARRRDGPAGNETQRKLGSALLWAREAFAIENQRGEAHSLCPHGRRLGRAGSKDGSRCSPACRQRSATARSLSVAEKQTVAGETSALAPWRAHDLDSGRSALARKRRSRFRRYLPRRAVKPRRRAIVQCLLRLASERGDKKTFCPSEVARHLHPNDWRRWMLQIRAEAIRLVKAGRLRSTQRGREVDPTSAHGPLRFSTPRTSDRSPGVT